MPRAIPPTTPAIRPQRPSAPTRNVIVVSNHPGKPGNANTSGTPPVPPRRHHLPSKQQAPSPVPLTAAQRIEAIRVRLANIDAESPTIDASQMMRELAALSHDRCDMTPSERDSIRRTTDAVMRRTTELLYKKEGLNIKKSKSWAYRLLAKLPFTRQHRVCISLKSINSIRQ